MYIYIILVIQLTTQNLCEIKSKTKNLCEVATKEKFTAAIDKAHDWDYYPGVQDDAGSGREADNQVHVAPYFLQLMYSKGEQRTQPQQVILVPCSRLPDAQWHLFFSSEN